MNGIGHYFARRYLSRANSQNVKRYPQLACFSFDLITQFIHLDGRYEHDELTFLEDHIFPSLTTPGLCLDIGANIGNHAVAFASQFSKVLAFEPNPFTFQILKINAALKPNIHALNLGASSEPGAIEVSQDPLNIAATSIGRKQSPTQSLVTFQLIRLDDLPEIQASEHPITFIKIDVEGHEHSALLGASETLRRHGPIIAMEVLPNDVENGTTASIDFLRSLGYANFYELNEGGWLGRQPRRRKQLARTLLTILTSRRPSKAKALAQVEVLEKRTYLMLLCSIEPLKQV